MWGNQAAHASVAGVLPGPRFWADIVDVCELLVDHRVDNPLYDPGRGTRLPQRCRLAVFGSCGHISARIRHCPTLFGTPGVFTPLVFLWFIVGYLMQHEELVHQRQQSRETQLNLGEQLRLLREQVEADHQSSLPRLKLEARSITGGQQEWKIRNYGAGAMELSILKDNDEQPILSHPALRTNEEIRAFAIPRHGAARLFRYEARFSSLRGEGFRQVWELRRTGEEGLSFEPAQEITDGPEILR